MKNYGVTIPIHSKTILNRIRTTSLKKYGKTHWMQSDDFYEKFVEIMRNKKKSSYKEFLLEGRVYYLQGYEDYVLQEFLLKQYKTKDIFIKTKDISNEIGDIIYDIDGKNHRYYPDFYHEETNTIIEIKSLYTFNFSIEKNIRKEFDKFQV